MKKLTTSLGEFGPYAAIQVFDNRYECDGAILFFTVVGQGEVSDYIPGNRVYTAEELAPLKEAKNAEINAARVAANATYFVHQGKQVACDALSRGDIDGTNGEVANSGALPPGWPGGWKAMDNSVIVIATVADWKAFYSSMWAQGAQNFGKSQALKSALASAATPEAVAAIKW